MDAHATQPGPSRARWSAIVAGALVVAGASGVGAVASQVSRPAASDSPAERIWPVNSGGLLFPIAATPMCEFLNNFGEQRSSHRHQGTDIGAQGPIDETDYPGQEVYAVEDATVYDAKFVDTGNDGIALRLSATDHDVQYRYFHLASIAEGIDEGVVVRRGQVIGYVGDTGNATPGGWHLHFELHERNAEGRFRAVDPLPVLAVPAVCTDLIRR